MVMNLLSFLLWFSLSVDADLSEFWPKDKFARETLHRIHTDLFSFIRIDARAGDFAYFLTLLSADVLSGVSNDLSDSTLGTWLTTLTVFPSTFIRPEKVMNLPDYSKSSTGFSQLFPQFWSVSSGYSYGMTCMTSNVLPEGLALTFEFAAFESTLCDQIYVSSRLTDHFIIGSLAEGDYDERFDTINNAENLQYLCFYHPAISGGKVSFDMNFTVIDPAKADKVLIACLLTCTSGGKAIQNVFPSVKIDYHHPSATEESVLFYRLDVKAIAEFKYLHIWFDGGETAISQYIQTAHWHFPSKTPSEMVDPWRESCVWSQVDITRNPANCRTWETGEIARDTDVYGEFPDKDWVPVRTISVTYTPSPSISPTPIFAGSNNFVGSSRFGGSAIWITPDEGVNSGTEGQSQVQSQVQEGVNGSGEDSGGIEIWIIIVIVVVAVLLIVGLIVGIILWRRKRSAPIEPLPGDEKGSEEEREDKTSQFQDQGHGQRNLSDEQFSDQLIDPDAHGDEVEVDRTGLDRPETQIPESSDFDAIPDIHDIDL